MIRLTYSLYNGGYAAHDAACPQARNTKAVLLISSLGFSSISEAREWADRDESDKAGDVTRAKFKACKCALASVVRS